ncbi:MAG: prolyl-tRNA synthetase associated domain-containing protein [Oscillospiraceae bacterium]|nr:prolyl-tRNA synthetase associated domain-containing protein [Oscillospiraceae bacterium]
MKNTSQSFSSETGPLTLHQGRPASDEGRTARELRTYDLLDSLKVPFERLDHEPAMTMEVCRDIEKSLHAMICKNLFLCNRQATRFYLLMIPADKPFKTRYLSARLGVSRLSFADEVHMEELLDLSPGSVSVMGLMNDHESRVQLVIDRDVLADEHIGCHPCMNTSSIRFKMSALLDTVLPAMGPEPVFVDLPWEP